MSDLIDRQKAIDAMCSACGYGCDKSKFVYDAPQDEQVILCPEHYALTVLPSVQPEQRWIPVSERLPERYGWYLCTLKDGRVNCYYWNNKGEWVDNGKKHFFDLYNIRSRYTGEEINPEQEGSVYWTDWVIAWMPLPEPYKEGEG